MNQDMKIMKVGNQFILSKHASSKLMVPFEEKETVFELICLKQTDYHHNDLEECMRVLLSQFEDIEKDLVIFLKPSFSIHEKRIMKNLGIKYENNYFLKPSRQNDSGSIGESIR